MSGSVERERAVRFWHLVFLWQHGRDDGLRWWNVSVMWR